MTENPPVSNYLQRVTTQNYKEERTPHGPSGPVSTRRPHSIEISTAKSLNLDHSRARNRWGSERPGETTGLCRQPRWEASPARDYGDWCVWRRVSQGFQNSLNEVKHRRGEGRGHANERARGGPSDLALCLSGTPSREGENANPEKRR